MLCAQGNRFSPRRLCLLNGIKKLSRIKPEEPLNSQSAAAPVFFTRYVKQVGALPPALAFP